MKIKQTTLVPILFLLLNIIPFALHAQKKITITGQVTNTKNEALPFCDVILTASDSSSNMLAFAMANANGVYKIDWEADTTAVQIEASSMGYAKAIKKLALLTDKHHYVINLKLEERTEEIEEVSVVAAPVVQVREDTTIFNLSLIRDSSEVVVEDLIKKLPGVTVEEGGKIKFKGKDLKTVLLDGDDLFEGKYTLGTKNIQADHVEGITAVENYTHNPLLRGVEITDDVILNLEFRPGLSLSHNLKAGVGPDSRYSITHKGIAITKKVKAYTLLDHNTLGSRAGQYFFNPGLYIGGMGRTDDTKAPSFLGLSMSATQGERNESYFGSINIMPHLTETFTARLNMDYFSDKAKREDYYKQIITTDPDNPIVIERSNRQTDLPRFFNSKLYLEKYLSESDRIDNTIVFSRKRNTSDNSGINNGVAQQLDKSAKDHYLLNKTQYTKRLKNGKSFYLTLTASSDESTEELLLMPGIDLESSSLVDGQLTTQDIKSEKQGAELSTMFLISLFKKHKINLGIKNTYYKTTLSTFLTGSGQNGDFSNDIKYQVFIPNVDFSYEYKYKKLRITPSLKLSLYNYDYENTVSLFDEQATDLLLNAKLSISYKLFPRHTVSLGLNNTESAPSDDKIYDNYILTSNRLLKNNKIDFGAQKSQSANITYRYESLFNDFSYSLGANYSKNNHQYQTDRMYNQDLTMYTSYLSNLGASSYGANASINTKFRKILDRLSLNYTYSNGEYYNAVNSDVVRKSENVQHNYTFNFQSKVFWNTYFDNRTSFSQSDYKTEGIKQNTTESLSNSFSLYMTLFKRVSAKANYNYFVPTIDDFDNANETLNASLRYTNKKKNIIFTLDAQNLINQRNNNNFSTNEYSQTISYNSLQRRFFLFAVEVRF